MSHLYNHEVRALYPNTEISVLDTAVTPLLRTQIHENYCGFLDSSLGENTGVPGSGRNPS